MKALVIGGGGFLGKHLIMELLDAGYEKITSFDLIHRSAPVSDKAEHVDGNLEDLTKLRQVVSGQHVVFHCASPPYHLNDREVFYKVNVKGTQLLVEVCKQVGCKNLVLVSSCSVVYNGTDLKNATEATPYPSTFLDYYTETKMLQERVVLEANCDDLHTVAIRPHGIFGEGDHTVSEMLKKAKEGKMKFIIGDGSNLVDFTYVRNVTYGLRLAACKLLQGDASVFGKAYNITNDEPVHFWSFVVALIVAMGYKRPTVHLPFYLILALSYLISFVCHILRKQADLSPFKICLAATHHYYSCERAKKELGYVPQVSVEDGLRKTLKSYEHMRLKDEDNASAKKTK